ncbi:MAG: hypothetical protein RMJ59_01060 [Candidatus Nitrosocaldus sp.]|nr:hypothetical protein [Candidatus Nitrosocaldus sp.]MCS7141314.1 hypothetical protein [Candidatus Nitrosocaldus sp.]MDW8000279.1 hypothetical protein [Candidatus Nitrosocaldus sp.]MDW8274954.1 hypothetical protein [Candidatus Nitrosocaldus sp.]
MSSTSEIVLMVDEKELKRCISTVSKEVPSLGNILRDIEKVITLSYSIASRLEREAESGDRDDALCTRLRLGRTLAYNSATSAAAILSLLVEYVKDKSVKADDDYIIEY